MQNPSKQNTSYVIAVAGGSGSGKTTLAKNLIKFLGVSNCSLLGQDSYYFDQSHKFDRDGGSVNFDHPDALDFNLMAMHLASLREGHHVEIPVYDFATHKRMTRTETVESRKYIFVDGTLILSQEVLLPLFHESIFLDVTEETRFARRLKRDTEERGRTPEGVKQQFFNQVKPMHDLFIEPNKSRCTISLATNQAKPRPESATNSDLRAELMSFFAHYF